MVSPITFDHASYHLGTTGSRPYDIQNEEIHFFQSCSTYLSSIVIIDIYIFNDDRFGTIRSCGNLSPERTMTLEEDL